MPAYRRSRAYEILGLPAVPEPPDLHEALYAQQQELEATRRELAGALERTNRMPSPPAAATPHGNSKAA